MLKSTITMILVALLIAVGCLWEPQFIKRNFNDFSNAIEIVYDKVEEQNATADDVYALQKNWLQKKRYLHTMIPHNEIKEVDLWLTETIKLVQKQEWTDAISKLEVLKELAEQIPQTFIIKAENVL